MDVEQDESEEKRKKLKLSLQLITIGRDHYPNSNVSLPSFLAIWPDTDLKRSNKGK